jgi:hypothetical protein
MAKLTDHIRVEDLFSAYIDQRVTADEKIFVERHVAACAACRAQLQSTRSMVAALKAMPVVRAPRSFVLPRSMAVQPKPSIFNWYPALRLATVMAAVAFVLVFAGDLLTLRPNGGGNVVMSASSPAAAAPTAVPLAPEQAPAAAPMAKSSPTDQQPPSAVPAPAMPAPAGAAPMVGAAANAQPTATMDAADAARAAAFSTQATPTETQSAYAMSDTAETTATVAMAPAIEPTPEPAVEAPVPAVTTAVPPAIDPLRLASIVLGGLVVVLGAATLIIRRGA